MKIKCNFCNGKCIKNGFQSNGNQRYKCTICQKRQQINYRYNAYKGDIKQEIGLIKKEVLRIKKSIKNTENISHNITKKNHSNCQKHYQQMENL